MKAFHIFVTLLSVFLTSDALRILGIIPLPSHSHIAVGNAIIKSLYDAGHDVTVLSPQALESGLNYRHISTADITETNQEGKK